MFVAGFIFTPEMGAFTIFLKLSFVLVLVQNYAKSQVVVQYNARSQVLCAMLGATKCYRTRLCVIYEPNFKIFVALFTTFRMQNEDNTIFVCGCFRTI